MKTIMRQSLILFAAFTCIVSTPLLSAHCSGRHKVETVSRVIEFQLYDSGGYPVEGTQFPVTIQEKKEGNKITLLLPQFSFQVGPQSALNPAPLSDPGPGFLRTVAGFLPSGSSPVDPVFRTDIVSSQTGDYMLNVSFFGGILIQAPGTFYNFINPGLQIFGPAEITYYTESRPKLCENVLLSTNGASNITQFVGTSRNLAYRDTYFTDAYDNIAANAYVSNAAIDNKANGATDVFVSIGKVKEDKLKANPPVQITALPPDILIFNTATAINRRDSNNVVVSYGLIDQTNPNFIGVPCRAVSTDGGQTWPEPYVYTAFMGSISGDTLTVTNMRYGTLKLNQGIYTVADFTTSGIVPGTVITSFVSGKGGVGTYKVSIPQEVATSYIIASDPLNGPLPILPASSTGLGDCRGVASDAFGNIWYSTSIAYDPLGNLINQPVYCISPGGGVTFTLAYTVPIRSDVNLGVDSPDFPQFNFGGGGNNDYGLWFTFDYFISYGFPFTLDIIPAVGFVPITGPYTAGGSLPIGPISSSTPSYLFDLDNTQYNPSICAANDGRVWTKGLTAYFSFYTPTVVRFKSPPNSRYPDAITSNYAGPWQPNLFAAQLPNSISNALQGFGGAFQGIIYDDARKALYALTIQQAPDNYTVEPTQYSQNGVVYLLISRNNGQTWSEPFYITSNNFANKGRASMALDTITGNLLFKWFDGRNDPSFESIDVYGAVLPASILDRLVKAIPYSNPIVVSGPATGAPPIISNAAKLDLKKLERVKNRDSQRLLKQLKQEESSNEIR